jgi:hypothetical protein
MSSTPRLRAHVETLQAAIKNIVMLPKEHPGYSTAREVLDRFFKDELHADDTKPLIPYYTY